MGCSRAWRSAACRSPRRAVLRWQREFPVLGIGALLSAMALVPGLNLLVPVLGTAAMTHLLHRGRRR